MTKQPRLRRTDAVQEPTPPHSGRHWYFEKRVSLDTIVGIIGIAIVVGGPFIIWGRAMESRVLAIEIHAVERDKNDEKREAEFREWRQALTQQLSKIGDQMTQTQIAIGVINGKTAAAPTAAAAR
jgi:hypothetical protein